jgi:putative DNA primase/helicase
MISKMIAAGYTPTQRGDREANFSCAWTAENIQRLDGDLEAWERRLVVIEFAGPSFAKRILRFTDLLMQEEAEGMLNWMVEGAIQHLKECDDIGDYRLTEKQRNRTTQLLAESDSLRHFVTDCIQRSPVGEDLSTEEMVAAYFDYSAARGNSFIITFTRRAML